MKLKLIYFFNIEYIEDIFKIEMLNLSIQACVIEFFDKTHPLELVMRIR